MGDYRKRIRSKTKRTHIPDRKCFVCGSKEVTNHHLVKVAKINGIMSHEGRYISEMPIPTSDLCPYHHHIAHILYGDINKECIITPEEAELYLDLMEITERNKIEEPAERWQISYNNVIDNTINTATKNIDKYTIESPFNGIEVD